eukprot:1733146-Rhodomonas_salina.2
MEVIEHSRVASAGPCVLPFLRICVDSPLIDSAQRPCVTGEEAAMVRGGASMSQSRRGKQLLDYCFEKAMTSQRKKKHRKV